MTALNQQNIQEPQGTANPAKGVYTPSAAKGPQQPQTTTSHGVAKATSATFKGKSVKALPPGTLTHEDSIKLNLLPLYPENSSVLDENVLTQYLHPTEFLTPSLDLLAVTGQDSSAIAPKADSLTIAVTPKAIPRAMQEKQLRPSGFNVDLYWLLPTLIILVSAMGWIRISSGKFFSSLFNAIFNKTQTDSLFKITHFRKSAWSVGLNVLFLANLALFCYEMMVHFGAKPSGIHGLILWALALGGILLIHLLKSGIYKFLGWVFNTRNQTQYFLFQVNILNKAFGIILLPIIVIIPYVAPEFELIMIMGGLLLFALVYIIQLTKGAKIILQEPISVFYMILYLCTLEILPIATLYKIVLQQ